MISKMLFRIIVGISYIGESELREGIHDETEDEVQTDRGGGIPYLEIFVLRKDIHGDTEDGAQTDDDYFLPLSL